MSEGGLFPWNVQKFFIRVVSGDDGHIEDTASESSAKNALSKGKKNNQSNVVEMKAEPALVQEGSATLIEFSKDVISARPEENEWEMLDDRTSNGSIGSGGIFVARAGSVRSISSLERESSSQTTLSVPYKIQRTASSSTIDSQDNTVGPSGKGALGVDYVEHIVLPTDTLQGVCIAYKVSASALRRANHFTGHSLHFAPKKLLIPLSKHALRMGFIRVQDTDSKEYKLHYFQAEYPDMTLTEAKA